MKKHSDLKHFLLKCWVKLTIFFRWLEKHPLLDRIVLMIVKIVIYLFVHKGK